MLVKSIPKKEPVVAKRAEQEPAAADDSPPAARPRQCFVYCEAKIWNY
jgi:hypothetical protein